MRVHSKKIVDETNITLSATYGSQQLDHIYGYSSQVVWSCSAASGIIILQASNNGTDWDDIPGTQIDVESVSGTKLFNFPDVFYKNCRVKVTMYTGALTSLVVENYMKGI